jgi:hypothetical protein
MNPVVGQWGPVAVIVGGYLLGIYFQNRRIDDLRDSINRRLDDLRGAIGDSRGSVNDLRSSMNTRFDDLHALLKSEIKRLDERFDRLEHPIIRQS